MRIAIVGTGYVGLTTGVCLASVGHEIACVDVVPERVAAIQDGQAPFYEPRLAELLTAERTSGRLQATVKLEDAVATSEVTFIAVGTPQTERGINLSFVREAAEQIGAALRRSTGYHVVTVKSTVVPGTTETLVRSVLEENSGRRAGEFGLCMNPEFLREGSAIDDFLNPDRIVIGQWDARSGKALAEVYRPFKCPKVFTSPSNAEMMKYASNALLATLISFSNEIAGLCEATPNTDVRAVLEGVQLDRRLSPMVDGQRVRPGILSFLWAGCGFGGSCLPKDVNALRAFAHEHNLEPRLLDAVMQVNAARPAMLVRLAEKALGPLRGKTIAVLGLAFKAGTDDLRESAALTVIRLLAERGAVVGGFDPIVKAFPADSGLAEVARIDGTPEETLAGADAAVITTACPEFLEWDWKRLCAQMHRPVIIDGRNAMDRVAWPEGVRYLSIGRVAENGKALEETRE